MKKKINVSICTGTACYVMGGAALLSLEDSLPQSLSEKVEISGIPCLGLCREGTLGKAPFVKIGQTVVSQATVDKVIAVLEEHVAQGTGQG